MRDETLKRFRRAFVVQPQSKRTSWVFLVLGLCNALLGVGVSSHQLSEGSPADDVFNGTYNLGLGIPFVAQGGVGLLPEIRPRLVATLQATYLLCPVALGVPLVTGFVSPSGARL